MTGKSGNKLRDYPGINVAQGLKYINGNEKLYVMLLKKFPAQCKEAPREIIDFLAAGQREDATRVAHNVKGLGSTLGMTECSTAAAALEQSIKAADDQFAPLLERFEKELSKTLDSIAALTEE